MCLHNGHNRLTGGAAITGQRESLLTSSSANQKLAVTQGDQ